MSFEVICCVLGHSQITQVEYPHRNNYPESCKLRISIEIMTPLAMKIEYPHMNSNPLVVHIEYPCRNTDYPHLIVQTEYPHTSSNPSSCTLSSTIGTLTLVMQVDCPCRNSDS